MTVTSALATAVDFACGIGLDETSRLAQRRDLKAKIKVLRRELSELEEVRELIRRLEGKKLEADAAHSATCLPLQAALAEAVETNKRLDLREKLSLENVALETRLRAIDAEINALRGDHGKRRGEVGSTISSLQSKLTSRELASPVLFRKSMILGTRCHWLGLRLQAADGQVERTRANMDPLHKGWQDRLADWLAERDAAQGELDAAKAEAAEIQAAILAE